MYTYIQVREREMQACIPQKLLLRMRIASYLYAHPEFVYLALFASVSGDFTLYRVVSTRIRIRNSIVSVSVPADWYFRA